MRLLFSIALKHLLARKRQSIVSLMGIILGVGFFLTISSMMQGSQNDFIRRLVDNSPHITINDEFREPHLQPANEVFGDSTVEIRSVKPLTEIRGLRGYEQILSYLQTIEGIRASAVLEGQALISYAGQEFAITLNGMSPEEMRGVTTIENYMKQGSVDDLITNPDGILIGAEMVRKLSLSFGDNISVVAPNGNVKNFKVLGIYKTGRSSYDERQGFANIKRVQSLFDRPNRVNSALIKMDEPAEALEIADEIESRFGYKSVSWQEASEDIRGTLLIRNIIMYSVVSAVLVVAAFGIYNVISTVVMEKQRDIAILKSMGFHARDVQKIFLIQGVILGFFGCAVGVPFGSTLMFGLSQVRFKPPGASEVINMPIEWGWIQFAIACTFAIVAAVLAALLPARKASKVQPVDILRGGT